MTVAPGNRTDLEQELIARLSELARAFLADLNAQGRLVETGGAETLRRLREQSQQSRQAQQGWVPQTQTGDAEAVEAAVHTAPAGPVLWTAIATSDTADSPPATDTTCLQQGSCVSRTGTGTEEPNAADGNEVQPLAAVAAARLRTENAGRLEVTQITSDHGRVTIHIHALSLDDWEYWLTAIGTPLNAPTHRTGWAQTATGEVDGVEVLLTAHDVPRLLEEATLRATEPFCLGGRVYDLALGHTDRHGQTWHYVGERQEDDTPLFTLGGSSGPSYPLPSIVTANGPLTPTGSQPRDPST